LHALAAIALQSCKFFAMTQGGKIFKKKNEGTSLKIENGGR